ncbi:hypothetical protein QA601_06070 [Chitinispirillales bacterium ANBcel5]|uniref:hypothetical protein n=1 Tax=Cellulosispirillum alkaliphilum TaxID=3039283 RepID=UPI002A502B70|nr:hypothetical protein [Chitinispirillales bacterium ANBcel5]
MATVEINQAQTEVLLEVLESTLSELRMEISHTDSPFYKDKLRDRKEELIALLDKFKALKEK